MRRNDVSLGLLGCLLLIGLIVSGCAAGNPIPIRSLTISPSTTANEGATLTMTMEVRRNQTGGGDPKLGRTIIMLFKPRSIVVQNDSLFFVTESVVSQQDGLTGSINKVTSGPALYGTELTRRKLLAHPFYGPTIEAAEAAGYEFWTGIADQPPYPATYGYGAGDSLHITGTLEGGGVGAMSLIAFNAFTLSTLQGDAFKGASKVYFINTSNDSIEKSDFAGISPGVNLRVGDEGTFGSVIEVAESGKIFISAVPANAGLYANDWPLVVGTNTFSIFDSNGDYEKTVYIPQLPSEGAPDNQYCPSSMVAAGGRLYVAAGTFGTGTLGNVRIYDEDGVLETTTPGNPYNPGSKGVSVNRYSIIATAESGRNVVIGITSNKQELYVLRHYLATATLEYVSFPLGHDGHSIWPLKDRRFAVAGENYVTLFNQISDVAVESYTLTLETTARGDARDPSPSWAVNDPDRGKLYVHSDGPGYDTGSVDTYLWVISYEAATPTGESVPLGDYAGFFALDKTRNTLYVPLLTDKTILRINLDDRSYTSPSAGGVPFGAFIANDNLYVLDVQGSGVDPVWEPPEEFGNLVKISSLPFSGTFRNVEVGYLPLFAAEAGNKLVVASSAIPAMTFDFDQENLLFQGTAPPSIVDVRIDGGTVINGDFISNSPVLTASLYDNSGIWDASVVVDGVDRTADVSFVPELPANTIHAPASLTLNIGSLSPVGTHSITIEATDGESLVTWEVSGLVASGGGGVAMRAGYPVIFPSVFKPTTGSAGPQGDRTLRLAYDLTVNAPITVVIVDISGKKVFTRKFSSGTNGGRAGYNEVQWNGTMDYGGIIGNGIYPYKIISGNKILARGHVVVFD
jgi:hypothetical protein